MASVTVSVAAPVPKAGKEMKEMNTEMVNTEAAAATMKKERNAEFSMEMPVTVEDYMEAGLVFITDEVGGEVSNQTVIGGVDDLEESNQKQGIINNCGGFIEMANAGGVEWPWEMEAAEVGGAPAAEWPGPWEFERDVDYFQWIWYCPEIFMLD